MGPTTPKSNGWPPGSGAGALGKCRRCYRQRKPSAEAFRPWGVEFMGGAWAQRSVGVKAHPQGWWGSLSQDRLIWQHMSLSIVCSARPKRDVGVMCAVGCNRSSSSESEAEPYNIWNALLAALVHFRIGEVLQPLLTSEDVGCVALSCHFACDARAPRLGCSRARLTFEWRVATGVAADPQRRTVEGSPEWGNGALARWIGARCA